VAEEDVGVLSGEELPFEKKMFDAVVIVDFLERVRSDELFIEECHKVLKPDGRLILNVARVKPYSFVGLLRRMLGLTFEGRGLARPGYTETDLFRILKDGFDVHNMRSYSRFFVELTHTFVQFAESRGGTGDGREKGGRRLYTVANVFYRVAFQLDMLLFFTRGFSLIASAKRRGWRPRKTPVLVDGRSITEAVLSRAAH
jgi:SAM-dependent methyltransferase